MILACDVTPGVQSNLACDSVLPFFDTTAQLAGVQSEYNHKQTVYGTSTKRNILYMYSVHRIRSGTIISCLFLYSSCRLVHRDLVNYFS